MEIIPSVNCMDLDCVNAKLGALGSFLKPDAWVHLDVADGRFTYAKLWGNPAFWPKPSFKLEVHLMVEDPELVVEDWLRAGAKRIIVHIEALNKATFQEIFDCAKRYHAELMLGANPETKAELFRRYYDRVQDFLVLAVHPGLPGQKFLPSVLSKVKFLRQTFSGAKIEVDGGINPETGRKSKEAGANILISASYLFGGENPKAAFETLENL